MADSCDAQCQSIVVPDEDIHAIRHKLADAVADHTEPSFAKYLDLVSFVAVITISFSLSASQGFATSAMLFGIALDARVDDLETKKAVGRVIYAAQLLAWAAATSGFSLMISLALRILQTSAPFVKRSMDKNEPWLDNLPRMVVGPGCFVALGLQAASMALIGEALKVTSEGGGWMTQGCLAFTTIVALFAWREGHMGDH
nr:hypothetical protein B0A51_17352 [Rachicladosporium sp. CCFEE 5018]